MSTFTRRGFLCLPFCALAALGAEGDPGFRADFVDIAAASGLTGRNIYGGVHKKEYILGTTGNGVAIFDYDGDGRNDIFIANGRRLGHAPSEASLPQLYHNEGHGHFRDVAREAGFTKTGWAQGVCVGDYNNDGHPDLFVTAYGHNTLYKNLGNGKFEDVTAEAGLPVTGIRYGSGCTFVDYDRDGHLDLFVANYVDLDLKNTPHPGSGQYCEWKGLPVMCGPRGLPKGHNILYHNNGNGTFTDVSEQAGILKPGGRYGLQAVAADFDNDGWPDIYVACDQTPSLLYRNLHNGTFEERGAAAGVAYNYDGELQAGMGVAVGDYDEDGLLDIAKTNFSGDFPSLFHNDDGKFFTDVVRQAGLDKHQYLGWGIAFVDVDNDGWPDLVLANGHVYPEVQGMHLGDKYLQPTLLYRNLGNGKFADVTKLAGPAFQALRPARGLAVGDIDGDGQPEIAIVNMNSTPSLLKNKGPHGHWLNLDLEGTKSNRSAIGARAVVQVGRHKMTSEVMSGGSYYSHNSFTLHYGLGKATAADSITIYWPSGIVQRIGRTEGDRTVRIVEKAGGQ